MKNSKTILTALFAAVVLATAISGCKKDSNPLNSEPVACFTISKDTVLVLDSVLLDASCSVGATAFSWSSPNGFPHNATGQQVHMLGYNPGNVEVTLTATNSKGTKTLTKSFYARDFMNTDFAGTYTCHDTCDQGTNYAPYTMTIVANGANGVTITFSLGSPVSGTVSGGAIHFYDSRPNGSTTEIFQGTMAFGSNNKQTIFINSTDEVVGYSTQTCLTTCTRM